MIRVLLLALAAGVFVGCPYHLSARYPVPFKSIAVLSFENRTSELLTGHELTKMVKQDLVRRTSASVTAGPDAEYVLSGSIIKIGRNVITEDSAGAVVSERITLEVRADLGSEAGREQFTVIGIAVFEKQNILSRDILIREALKDAARKIIDRIIDVETTSDV